MKATKKRADGVSSPAATGGAGTFFEQHVNAYWLSLLLVRGIPPILHDCALVEVHFQSERLGWKTDDFVVVGENGPGLHRKLLGQVKRAFTVSATNTDCKNVIQDFWTDFKNNQFSPAADRFVLVTLRGTNTLLEHFAGLLDCCRSARDAAEFESRMATSGFLNSKSVHYCEEIRTIVSEFDGKSVSAGELWPFLRALHVLSLDLNSSTRQTEAIIKTLLAHTAKEQDAVGAAEATWNVLLRDVGEGMPEARSYTLNDLPEAVRQRHSAIGGAEDRILRAMSDHSAIILAGIRATIGPELHLPRGRLIQQVIEELESVQVVVVTGAAGSGKSGIAKDALGALTGDCFGFSFRAEEFARSHLDETLQNNQIPANATTLGAILAGQGRKVVLVESVERLLETSTRDGFTDLLTLVARDKSWKIILTCRDYSVDVVRSGILESSRVGHAVVTVPPLNDEELREVEAGNPSLVRPLANATLRRMLCNPYVLDKALQISWSNDRPLPRSEREFRELFWREIIKVDHRAAGGMPRRRETAFVQVALRRARALTMHAICGDLDAEVIRSLQIDSLIVRSRDSDVLLAPTHDVLEDWAILHWIDEQNAILQRSATELAAAIGTHPAVRRTYRKWVSELLERDPEGADDLFRAVVLEATIPAQFRDDTLVSLLRSHSSAAFLERHRADLLANDKRLLSRVIHLLRVACVTTPAWFATTEAQPSLFNVPEGPAWACALRLVQTNLSLFTAAEQPLLLGFIEDWARGVTLPNPYPEGAEAAAAIGHWLLSSLDDYRSEDQRTRVLQVIAKIPNADPQRFAALLQGDRKNDRRHHAAEEFREIIIEGLHGMPAARDMPSLIADVGKKYLMLTDGSLRRTPWGYGDSMVLEPLFGVKVGGGRGFFPASAYRGPFLAMLRYHLREGLAFVVSVFNHSADWYAHPRVHSEFVEPPVQLELSFADGSTRVQWCNARLWNLYRGTSVGPNVLQSILMALEHWLLEFAEARPRDLDNLLLHILRHGDSAALTAVVASVATAFPQSAGETLLVLLRSQWCVLLDRIRLMNESQAPSKLPLPRLDPGNKTYDEERKSSDAKSHRLRDLEIAIANLQLGPFAQRVRELLDQLRADMPPIKEQSEEDRAWRLAIHRMDLRQYAVAEEEAAADAPKTAVTENGADSSPAGPQQIRLELKPPEPDVKEMVDQSTVQFQAFNDKLGLLMWGMKVYRGEERSIHKPTDWRRRLEQAQTSSTYESDNFEPGDGGPGYVAAICIRDHWDEMDGTERAWCVDRACLEIERTANNWNQTARVQRYEMAADRPCAWVMARILGKEISAERQLRVRSVLIAAITHPVNEVRWFGAWGTGKNLWTIDRTLTLRCVYALAHEAIELTQAAEAERERMLREQDFDRFHSGTWFDEVSRSTAEDIRRRFLNKGELLESAIRDFDASEWCGAEAYGRILAVLSEAPAEPAAILCFSQLTRMLVDWWDADDDRRNTSQQRRRERSFESESALFEVLQYFLLRADAPVAATILQPILEAVDHHPKEVERIVKGLIFAEDACPNTSQFWMLWSLFKDRIGRAPWMRHIDGEYSDGRELLSAIFLGIWWKDDLRHWRGLDGNIGRVDALFESLPASARVLDQYVRFLHHVGEKSLPEAFIRIMKRLQGADTRVLLRSGNTIFLLELLLRRFVYGRPLEIKRQIDLRNAVLGLLDVLVENGSSAAFRMRDDFVTPLPV